jgi:TetR/AcrR family transcriptional regulator, ethionamide resistance regulator
VPARTTPSSETPRRRRRSPAAAEGEIIAAADGLLRERPFRELTVDEVMRRTGLSRPSFYVYFPDRHHLVLRVVQLIGAELFTMSDRWLQGEGDGPTLARAATEGIVGVFAQHGPVLRALADAAADDPDVELAHRAIMDASIEAAANHIQAEQEAGNMLPVDATETARALSIMTDRYLVAVLGRDRNTDPDLVVETLCTIWIRTLYGAR